MENSQKYYDIEILTRELKEGKEVAFDYLFRTRYKKLCRFAATFVVQFDVAEDIVQEVFEKIWKKSTRIDERASIDSYLFVAVRNACFTFLKNKQERVDLEDVKQNLKISEEVVKYAHKSDIDCIVVGAHGRIGFRQLFAGSVATEVVKKAHCSVSVIRPRY